MVPTTLQNSFPLTFQDKTNRRDTNNLWAKRAEKNFELLYALCIKQFKIFSASVSLVLRISLTLLLFPDFEM